MMEENIILGKKIASKFNKKYGVITYSGILAIELALKCLHLKKKSKVIIISEICYSIVNTIIKLDLTPVIVETTNFFELTDEDLDNVLAKEKIDCIILAHQYGILSKIDKSKYHKMGIKIIEDCAQVWNIEKKDYPIGEYSDFVVTSFGETKPLSYGIGGGAFFDSELIYNYIDYCNVKSRESAYFLLSYTYPLSSKIDFERLNNDGVSNILEQKHNSSEYLKILKKQSIIKYLSNIADNVWHRYPIWVETQDEYKLLLSIIEKTNLEYQTLHNIPLSSLKRNKRALVYNLSNSKKYVILLRTRTINLQQQKVALKDIIKGI